MDQEENNQGQNGIMVECPRCGSADLFVTSFTTMPKGGTMIVTPAGIMSENEKNPDTETSDIKVKCSSCGFKLPMGLLEKRNEKLYNIMKQTAAALEKSKHTSPIYDPVTIEDLDTENDLDELIRDCSFKIVSAIAEVTNGHAGFINCVLRDMAKRFEKTAKVVWKLGC